MELMICLAIIGLLGALLGTKGTDLLAYHQFQSSMQTFLLDIQKWQILSMTQGSDVVCRIQKKNGKYFVYVEPENQIGSLTYELKEVSKLFFEGKPVENFQMTLLSSGRVFPSGLLKVETKAEKAFCIDFSYPKALLEGSFKKSPFPSLPIYPEKRKEVDSL